MTHRAPELVDDREVLLEAAFEEPAPLHGPGGVFAALDALDVSEDSAVLEETAVESRRVPVRALAALALCLSVAIGLLAWPQVEADTQIQSTVSITAPAHVSAAAVDGPEAAIDLRAVDQGRTIDAFAIRIEGVSGPVGGTNAAREATGR